ncbi:MAG: hypothetical protein ACNA7Y_01270 [Gammaproteobacteria bacterium]
MKESHKTQWMIAIFQVFVLLIFAWLGIWFKEYFQIPKLFWYIGMGILFTVLLGSMQKHMTSKFYILFYLTIIIGGVAITALTTTLLLH